MRDGACIGDGSGIESGRASSRTSSLSSRTTRTRNWVRADLLILLPHPFPLLCGFDVSYETPHLTRSCASSPDSPLSDKSFLMLSNNLRFCLPILLFPGNSITITLLPTYSSSLLNTCPYHFNLVSCTSLDISPTFVVPPILSFLILSSLVTPLIHLKTSSFLPHPTSSIVLSSLPKSRHRTSLLVLQPSYIRVDQNWILTLSDFRT